LKEEFEMYKHILFPTDGAELSLRAERECIALAKSIGARITVIHVVPQRHMTLTAGRGEEAVGAELIRQLESQYDEVAKKNAEAIFTGLQERARTNGVQCYTLVVVGNEPYKEIIEHAQRLNCDLVLMASHGRKGLEGLLLGSETIKVLTHCKVPVLVVR
jgi:nucleotide-binding universal stress UspA family protein